MKLYTIGFTRSSAARFFGRWLVAEYLRDRWGGEAEIVHL